MSKSAIHTVNGHSLYETPAGMAIATFAMGCFWGVERLFWQQPGVYSTAVGYTGGHIPHPTYHQVCSGQTGHAEAVQVVFEPHVISYTLLLKLFWENHDPTQGLRQGNDIGSQYRSAIYVHTPKQHVAAQTSLAHFQHLLQASGKYPQITTVIVAAQNFYLAEEEHQRYLLKNPEGYCSLAGTGLCLPVA